MNIHDPESINSEGLNKLIQCLGKRESMEMENNWDQEFINLVGPDFLFGNEQIKALEILLLEGGKAKTAIIKLLTLIIQSSRDFPEDRMELLFSSRIFEIIFSAPEQAKEVSDAVLIMVQMIINNGLVYTQRLLQIQPFLEQLLDFLASNFDRLEESSAILKLDCFLELCQYPELRPLLVARMSDLVFYLAHQEPDISSNSKYFECLTKMEGLIFTILKTIVIHSQEYKKLLVKMDIHSIIRKRLEQSKSVYSKKKV